MTKALWFRLVFYTFVVAIAFGVYLEFGLGWSLMVGGVIGAASALTLHDVDDEKDGKK